MSFFIYNPNSIIIRTTTNKILSISNVDNMLLRDMLYIKNFLQRFGTILSFRTVTNQYNNKMWLVEFLETDAINQIIQGGLINLMKMYPMLHVGYF